MYNLYDLSLFLSFMCAFRILPMFGIQRLYFFRWGCCDLMRIVHFAAPKLILWIVNIIVFDDIIANRKTFYYVTEVTCLWKICIIYVIVLYWGGWFLSVNRMEIFQAMLLSIRWRKLCVSEIISRDQSEVILLPKIIIKS